MSKLVTIVLEPGPQPRPPEPPAPSEILVGEVVVLRRDVVSPYPYVAYRAEAPRIWQNVLWGRAEWIEVCHLLGFYPCRIECLRRPLSWPGPIPPGWGEMSALELAGFFVARHEGRETLIGREGPPPPSKRVDPSAPRPPPLVFEHAPHTEPTPVDNTDEVEDFGLPPFEWPSSGQGKLF